MAAGPLIAVVGDATATRNFDPPMNDAARAKRAAEELGRELAQRGARLLVYGGPFIEADFVRGFIAGKPKDDHGIVMWYSKDNEPQPFIEEKNYPKFFERHAERGSDWETTFYKSISRADGLILIGGGSATKICGHVAIGMRMPLLSMPEFGGAAAKVWSALSAGEDLPNRLEIDAMAKPWSDGAASDCVNALLAQKQRKRSLESSPRPDLAILAAILFLIALGIVSYVWGQNELAVWMLFLAPLLAGGAGAALRPNIDRLKGNDGVKASLVATIVVGIIAGGIAGILFVTAQLTADPAVTENAAKIVSYAQRSIPYAVGVGFVAGLTSDSVFGKLLGLDVMKTSAISNDPSKG